MWRFRITRITKFKIGYTDKYTIIQIEEIKGRRGITAIIINKISVIKYATIVVVASAVVRKTVVGRDRDSTCESDSTDAKDSTCAHDRVKAIDTSIGGWISQVSWSQVDAATIDFPAARHRHGQASSNRPLPWCLRRTWTCLAGTCSCLTKKQ